MRLQGAISPRVEARLDEMLGHPETCPHGNPIDAETAKRRPAGVPLSEIVAGERATVYRITEEAEEDAGLLSYLEARALMPGAHVTILARSESLDSLTLDGPRGRATLGLRPAALVRVLPGDADPGALPHRSRASTGRVTRPMDRASGSPRARPGRSTSGRPGPRCSTTCTPDTSAGRSSSGSRTPTRRRSSIAYEKDILDGLHWLGLHWDEGPEVAGEAARGPYAPYRQMQRLPQLRGGRGATPRRGPRLSLLLHARGARGRPQGPGGGEAPAEVRRALREPDRGRARRQRGRGPPRCAAVPGR